jgi:hypothetical protein
VPVVFERAELTACVRALLMFSKDWVVIEYPLVCLSRSKFLKKPVFAVLKYRISPKDGSLERTLDDAGIAVPS